MGSVIRPGVDGFLVPPGIGCPDRRVGLNKGRCRSQGPIFRSGERGRGRVFDGKASLDVGRAFCGVTVVTMHATEVSRGDRFEFGANWVDFLSVLNEDRIAQAEQSLRKMLRVSHLEGKRFLDIGRRIAQLDAQFGRPAFGRRCSLF
jgi:hypothetical protein